MTPTPRARRVMIDVLGAHPETATIHSGSSDLRNYVIPRAATALGVGLPSFVACVRDRVKVPVIVNFAKRNVLTVRNRPVIGTCPAFLSDQVYGLRVAD